MCYVRLNGTILIIKVFDQVPVDQGRYLFATASSMGGRIKGHHFVVFFYKRLNVFVKIDSGRFKPMKNKRFPVSSFVPSITTDSILFKFEMDFLSIFKYLRQWFCIPVFGCTK